MPTSIADVEKLEQAEQVQLQAALEKLTAATTDEAKEAALKEYHDVFVARTKNIELVLTDKAVADSAATATTAEDEARRAEEEADALQKQLDALETGSSSGAATIRATPAKPYLDFLVARAELDASVTVLRNKMKAIVAETAFKMHDARGEPQSLVDGWSKTAEELGKKLLEVTAAAAAMTLTKDIAKDVDVMATAASWKATAEMVPIVNQKVADDRSSRDSTDEAIRSFEHERQRLLLWCRQQKTNLDAIVEPDQIQEFCASLLANFPSMDDNIAVLLEIAEPLLPNPDVQQALLEVNEVWLNLQISAYERLRHTLLEIHPKSRLEDEVRAFANYSTRANDFLNEFSKLLSQPSDAESQSAVKSVVDDCGRLREQFAAHAKLADHLRDFALRMECFRDSYNNLRRAVFGRLTFLSSNLPSLATSMKRKEEYVARMKDLKKWVEVKSQGESWADIHQRVLRIRDLIEEEQRLLAENPPQEPAA